MAYCQRFGGSAITLLLLFLLIVSPVISISFDYVDRDDSKIFRNPRTSTETFEKMVIDPSSRRIFVCGVNVLYDLNPDELTVRLNATTRSSQRSLSKSSKQAHCKGLAVSDKTSQLIECSSEKGLCRVRNLHNITQIQQTSSNSIVGLSSNSSTVLFIARSPNNTGPALYTGVTYAPSYKVEADEVPAVSSRYIEQDFQYFGKTAAAEGSYVMVESAKRSTFLIDYVYGFEAGSFWSNKNNGTASYAYFATRQQKWSKDKSNSEASSFESRLIRVCTGDQKFESYVEVSLNCSSDILDYNLLQDAYVAKAGFSIAKKFGISVDEEVLVGVFSAGDNRPIRNHPSSHSAVCIYLMKDIEKIFMENILQCFRWDENPSTEPVEKGLPWFYGRSSEVSKCTKTRHLWPQIQCGINVNTKIGGSIPIMASPVLTVDDALFTSVAVNMTHGNLVAFVGTSSGNLLKIHLIDKSKAELYSNINVANGEPILADMEFSEDGKFIYILTPSMVIKHETSRCERATSCKSCLELKDPFCGWCERGNICSTKNSCEMDIPRMVWLDGTDSESRCMEISSVEPNEIQMRTASNFEVKIQYARVNQGKFSCVFRFGTGPEYRGRPTKLDSNGALKCETPETGRLPPIPKNSSYINAFLDVRSEDNRTLATSNFTFYDCGLYTSCTECTSSPFPCDWCLESAECVSGKVTEDRCRKQPLVNGLNRKGKSLRKGPSKCPHIVASPSTLFVASGERKSIPVKIQNLHPDLMSDFYCRVQIDGKSHEKRARKLNDDSILCDEMTFEHHSFALNGGVEFVNFDVIWSSSGSSYRHAFDNENLKIGIYKCEALGANCGKCLTLDADQFDCGWCMIQDACTRPLSCRAQSERDFLNSTHLCPNPIIKNFSPTKGPTEGATRLRISGENLGRSFKDIQAVQVANSPCRIEPIDYVPATTIFCITSALTNRTGPIGPIAITLKSGKEEYFNVTRTNFQYVNPSITKLLPNGGPQNGGTDVRLFGENLDSGSEVMVTFGGVNCRVLHRNESEIICRTGPANDSGSRNGRLKLIVDGKPIPQPMEDTLLSFNYSDNPLVDRIYPESSIVSGGVLVDVQGQGFRALQRPHLVFKDNLGDREVGPLCNVIEDSLMLCRSPRATPTTASNNGSVSAQVDLDGSQSKSFLVNIYPDPIISPFTEDRYYRKDEDSITINGKNLNTGVQNRDISITVGGIPCNLTALASGIMICKPPSERPPLDGNLEPEILAKIGNVVQPVGILSYKSPAVSKGVWMTVISVFVLMMAALVVVIICYKRNTNSHKRQMKVLKNQMDTIEMKVATECKEAFAELQTSLNQYTADLPLGTPIVPFLDYKDYCARVLFPNNPHNHPVLRELEVDSSRAASVESGLREFHKLLMNKTFFLTMVRTMEANKYFLGRDRVYVGSLIMVVLQEKMGYCTEMLKQLLRELIERTVEKKFQPKILFRRSESIAERMLAAWFTFLMHDYLRNFAGKRLYDLYWGIKQQMEKGPQDAITLEARYSLSEEKLLRATFDYRELTVFIASDSVYSHADIPLRVLDCDTITQVKEKCLDAKYRTVRFSERPAAGDLELEWRAGTNGRIVLQDIDSTSVVEASGWKRLNTLAHYKVPNNAVLMLVSKQNTSMYNLVDSVRSAYCYTSARCSCTSDTYYALVPPAGNVPSLMSDRSEKSNMSIKNSPTLSRPWGGTTSSSNSKDENYKEYHLVKPSEHGPSTAQEKMVTEIYLTRLLMMKGTLQKFINDLLEAIFSTSRSAPLPPAVKYMFDFMDSQAAEHGITDPEVVHAWKSNALPLRFWVNLIKNPNFVFDIQKPTKVEGCLSVVAQTLMDACSTQDHHLTKDSPSSKLLFAKDMYQYRDWVDSYYTEIGRMPPIKDQDMGAILTEESRSHRGQFHVFSALNELYKYLDQYKDDIMEALEANEHAQASRLPSRLQNILAIMEQDALRPDYESSTLGHGYNSNSRLMPRDRM